MICRASRCLNEPMPISAENPLGLCGKCHEDNEESPVRLKSGPREVTAESVAKRNATRKANQEAKATRYANLRGGV
jgi:hypothetical protein